jgi:hypothetical protein
MRTGSHFPFLPSFEAPFGCFILTTKNLIGRTRRTWTAKGYPRSTGISRHDEGTSCCRSGIPWTSTIIALYCVDSLLRVLVSIPSFVTGHGPRKQTCTRGYEKGCGGIPRSSCHGEYVARSRSEAGLHNEKWPRLAGRLLAGKRLPLEATAVNHMTREQDAVV